MDVATAIKTRRSIREYKDTAISKEALEKIVDAARYAPTARNLQPWEFVVITKRQMLDKIAALTEYGKFIAQSVACIAVFCSDTKYYLEDGSAATVNIMLEARTLGIGSCWVAGDKKPYCGKINEMLGAPSDLKLVSLVSLGYPKSESEFKAMEKRPLKGLLRWEKF